MATDRLDRFLDDMRASGLRVTTTRRIIARHLVEAGGHGHVTGQDLAARVRSDAPEIDQSTVYRFLDTVGDLGLTVRRHLGGRAAVNHLAEADHVHLVCTGCGAVQEADPADFAALTAAFTKRYGFTIRPETFAVEGRCSECDAR